MADHDFVLGEGDTAPRLKETLLVPVDPDDPDADQFPNGRPADLTGATVIFLLRPEDQSVPSIPVPVSIVGDPTLGNVQVLWPGSTPGRYTGRFKAVTGAGDKISFRNDRLLTIEVTADP